MVFVALLCSHLTKKIAKICMRMYICKVGAVATGTIIVHFITLRLKRDIPWEPLVSPTET